MSFILGFGQSEIDTAKSIIKECYDAIINDMENAKEIIDSIKKKYKDQSDKYGEMKKYDAPERYSTFWANIMPIKYDMYFVCHFSFTHINRRHALSPDGWACLQTKWILFLSELDDMKCQIYKEA